jgi:hypothetical protein
LLIVSAFWEAGRQRTRKSPQQMHKLVYIPLRR